VLQQRLFQVRDGIITLMGNTVASATPVRQPLKLLNERRLVPSNYANGSDSAQSDVSEMDLVKRCQAGDPDAFDQLVTRYRHGYSA